MTCIELFCTRLEGAPGDHSCELPSGHPQACVCECADCLAALVPALVPAALLLAAPLTPA